MEKKIKLNQRIKVFGGDYKIDGKLTYLDWCMLHLLTIYDMKEWEVKEHYKRYLHTSN